MFVTMVGAAVTTAASLFRPPAAVVLDPMAVWLWFTVLFANFAEALAEGRGKAQAATLRKTRTETIARRLGMAAKNEFRPRTCGRMTLVVCETGDVIPADGEVIEGIASVDESAVTGESAPVIRESGGDRSAVTGGTRVSATALSFASRLRPGQGFLDRMIALVEGAKRQKTPNEIALTFCCRAHADFSAGLLTLKPFGVYSQARS